MAVQQMKNEDIPIPTAMNIRLSVIRYKLGKNPQHMDFKVLSIPVPIKKHLLSDPSRPVFGCVIVAIWSSMLLSVVSIELKAVVIFVFIAVNLVS